MAKLFVLIDIGGLMDIFKKVVAIVGRNGVVVDVVKKSESSTKIKAEATILVQDNDYRRQIFEISKKAE